jgi:SAM-dependent methyltransferase
MATQRLLSADRFAEIVYSYGDYPIYAPVSVASVDRLLSRASLPDGARILDLGCGAGAWMRRALQIYPTATADGVDLSASALTMARTGILAEGLAKRTRLHEQDATTFDPGDRYDLVLCLGISRAFGGLRPTLDVVGKHLRAGGLVLTGDNFLECEPPQALTDKIPDLREACPDLAGMVDLVLKAGWLSLYGHVSRRDELEETLWINAGSLNRWAMDNPDDPVAAEARELAAKSLDEGLRQYRGVIGYLSLLLAPSALDQASGNQVATSQDD